MTYLCHGFFTGAILEVKQCCTSNKSNFMFLGIGCSANKTMSNNNITDINPTSKCVFWMFSLPQRCYVKKIDPNLKINQIMKNDHFSVSGLDRVSEVTRYLLSASQNLRQVFPHFSRAVQANAPGVVDDACRRQQRRGPRQGRHDA